jgi:hypothetical protein
MKVNNDDDDNDDDDSIFVFKWAVAKVPQEHSASFQDKVTELIGRYDYIIYMKLAERW